METRGRNKGLTLNGLFWRYLLTTAAWSAALCLAALYLVQLLVLLGVILPAGAGEWSLDQTAAALQAQETFAPEEIPSVKGPAMGLWKKVCNRYPDRASPPPRIPAAAALGKRIPITISV